MHSLQACLFTYINVPAFCIYAQHGEDATKMGDLEPCIKLVMEMTLLIVDNHGKIIELCF